MTDQPGDGRIDAEDILLMLDGIALQVMQARRIVLRYVEGQNGVTTPSTGGCPHARTVETFDGAVCRDCGESVGGGDGVSPGDETAPTV